jgi:hypothetical protein
LRNGVEKKNKKIIHFFIGIKKRFFTFAPRLRGSENREEGEGEIGNKK